MDVRVIKAVVRTLVALFAAFFGAFQLSMTVCRPMPGTDWTRWLCHAHSTAFLLLSFACLFALTLLVLSGRFAAFRRPLAVLFCLLTPFTASLTHLNISCGGSRSYP